MIKTIIKNDGSREPLIPAKLNGWGEWAAKTLGSEVDWSEVVLHVVSTSPEEVTSQQLQESLIKFCLEKGTWEHNRMAGRLYSPLMNKQIHGKKIPTIQELHQKLFDAGIMVKLNYSDEEYAELEKVIDHRRDLKCAQYELQQIRWKYALRDKVNKKEYETPQFVYMRMAMALAENEPKESRMHHVKKFYEHLSKKRINVPTPYFTNLGTMHNGYASCCLYTTKDTWPSLAAGDHIAYVMTCMSAGIGSNIVTRALGDPIRGGLIEHQGKLPYYRAMVGAIGANLQNGRGGAATVYYSGYDPEVEVIQKLKNPMTPTAKQVRGCDYSFGSNKFYARQVAKNGDIGLFSYKDCPELYDAQYAKDQSLFERLYNKAVQEGKIKKFVNARQTVLGALSEAEETGRHYLHNTDAMNKHTPFKEPIRQSNLCAEIATVTKGFDSVAQLYQPIPTEEFITFEDQYGSIKSIDISERVETHRGTIFAMDLVAGDELMNGYQDSCQITKIISRTEIPEISLCNIAGIIPSNIDSDEMYAEVAYYALLMIDIGIHKSSYPFKNLEDTAKARMNAGVGIIGLAHVMAKKHLKYTSQEGKNFIHELFETHAWHLYNAALKLGQERGNAPWMHKTLFPDGWTPLSTYEKKVDTLVTVENKRDWNDLSNRIVKNKGIRFSVVSAHMPGEQSSRSAAMPNGPYPIRDFDLIKTSELEPPIYYVAPDSTKLKNHYQIAWDIPTSDLIDCYAIMQKWTDQAISADLYRKVQGSDKVSSTQMIADYLRMHQYGVKTRYYQNTLTAKGVISAKKEEVQDMAPHGEHDGACESCSL